MTTKEENKNSGFINAMYLCTGSLLLYMALLGIIIIGAGRIEKSTDFMLSVKIVTPFVQILAAMWLLKHYFKS